MTVQKVFAILTIPLLVISALALNVIDIQYLSYELEFGLTMMIAWAISLLLWSVFFGRAPKKLLFYVISFFVFYALIVAGTSVYEAFIDYKLDQFDTNHDMIFSKEEQTVEQQIYFNALINDLGRNLIAVTGLAYSLVSSLLLLVVLKIYDLRGRRGNKNSTHNGYG